MIDSKEDKIENKKTELGSLLAGKEDKDWEAKKTERGDWWTSVNETREGEDKTRRRIDSKEDRNGCKKTEVRSLITDK